MSLRNYIGFATDRIGITTATNPTSASSPLFGGIFNVSLEDQQYTKTPAFINNSTTATSGGANVSSLAVNTPTHSEGDLLLTFIASVATTRTYSSSGWTVERSNGTGFSMSVLSKIATSTEPASHTFTITGGTTATNAVMVAIRKWSSYSVGNFSANNAPVDMTAPDDSSNEKLLLFSAGNSGSGRSFDIGDVSEFQIQLNNTNAPSLDIDAVYVTTPTSSTVYSGVQTGGGTNSIGIIVLIK